MRPLVLLVSILVFTPTARAWSYKEHIQLTRMAVERLIAADTTPPAMKEWLKGITPGLTDHEGEKQYFLHTHVGRDPSTFTGLSRWAVKPDEYALAREAPKIEPFGLQERLLHFIDLELFLTGDAKREYRDDLSAKPRLEDVPRDMNDPRYAQAGMLPLRTQYAYGKLVDAIRAGKLDRADDKLEGEENSAARWAGYLAHYLEDNTQPQHSTIDYKSASYFPRTRRPPDVHGQVEYRMADDENNEHAELRAEYWPIFAKAIDEFRPPIETDDKDVFRATLQVSMYSYDALPMIGRSAARAYHPRPNLPAPSTSRSGRGGDDDFDTEAFFRGSGEYHGKRMTVMEMKAFQQAWAVHRVQKILRQAWDEAKR
jgi:hypothetical protein